MNRFYSGFGYISCPHGCNAKLQALAYNEDGNPLDMDWSQLQLIYDNHRGTCSQETPYTSDANSYYGDSEACYETPCEYGES